MVESLTLLSKQTEMEKHRLKEVRSISLSVAFAPFHVFSATLTSMVPSGPEGNSKRMPLFFLRSDPEMELRRPRAKHYSVTRGS